jgi:hypothetical protein
MRRFPRFLVALVTVSAMAGCSSDGDVLATSTGVGPGAGQPVSADVLREATAQSSQQAMAIEMTADISAMGEDLSMDVTGQISADGTAGEMTMSMSMLGESFDLSMRITPDKLYMRFDSLPADMPTDGIEPGVWYYQDITDIGAFGAPGMGQAYDPDQFLSLIEDHFGDVESLGSDDIDGVTAEGYRVELSMEDLLGFSGSMSGMDPGFSTDELDDAIAELEGSSMTIDAWVADGVVVKMLMDAELVSSQMLGEMTMHFDMRMRPLEGDVVVEAPEGALPLPGTFF